MDTSRGNVRAELEARHASCVFNLILNGKTQIVHVDPNTPLLYVLRDTLGPDAQNLAVALVSVERVRSLSRERRCYPEIAEPGQGEPPRLGQDPRNSGPI